MIYNLQAQRRETLLDREELVKQVEQLQARVEEQAAVATRPKVSLPPSPYGEDLGKISKLTSRYADHARNAESSETGCQWISRVHPGPSDRITYCL